MNKGSSLNTPCFVIKEAELEGNIINFKSAFETYFPNCIFSYSVKTNSLPYVLQKIKEYEGFAEVVSADEYHLAKHLGFQDIVYNGLAKSKETFIEALIQGNLVNIDTWEEIEWLEEVAPRTDYKLGIRVNIELPEHFGEKKSRFGFSSQSGALKDALKKIREKGFMICGIHLHRNTVARSVEVYQAMCIEAIRIMKQEGMEVRYFDIGGGFYGDYPGKPTYEEYAYGIYQALKAELDLNQVTIVTEPGNSIIASPVEYICKIKDCKETEDRIYYLTDGMRNHVDPLFQKEKYTYEIRRNQVDKQEIIEKEILPKKEQITKDNYLVGSSCMEKDVILSFGLQETVRVGDYIVFTNVGAYTMTLIPNFINLQPPIYVKHSDEFFCVREKWDVSEWVQKNMGLK